MEAVPGGRLCAKCANTIVDFRKMSWGKIKAIQTESGNTTCGLYSQKQLDNWMPKKKDSSPLLKQAMASLFLMGALSGQKVYAHSASETHPVFYLEEEEKNIEPLNVVKDDSTKVTIRGMVTDSETNEPLTFVKVYLKEFQIGATTDFDGFFTLQIPKSLTDSSLTLTVEDIMYQSASVDLTDKMLSGSLFEIQLEKEKVNLSVFYVSAPSKRDERKLKRQERREKRKAKRN
jgi:hypothetical protein